MTYAHFVMMMRAFRLPLGLTVVALVVAAGLHFGLPGTKKATGRQLTAMIDEIVEVTKGIAEMSITPTEAPAAPAPVVAAKEVFAPGTKTLLLSEPVIILGNSGQPREALPKGSQVALVGNYGEYSQVRYQGRLITVPTSSVVAGVYVSK
jgi:hypothetical protein